MHEKNKNKNLKTLFINLKLTKGNNLHCSKTNTTP